MRQRIVLLILWTLGCPFLFLAQETQPAGKNGDSTAPTKAIPLSEMADHVRSLKQTKTLLRRDYRRADRAELRSHLKAAIADLEKQIKSASNRARDAEATAIILKILEGINGLDPLWKLRNYTLYDDAFVDLPEGIPDDKLAEAASVPMIIIYKHPIKIWINRGNPVIREAFQRAREYDFQRSQTGNQTLRPPFVIYRFLVKLGHEDYHDRFALWLGHPPATEEEKDQSQFCAVAEGENKIIDLLFNKRLISFEQRTALRQMNNKSLATIAAGKTIVCPLLPPRNLASLAGK